MTSPFCVVLLVEVDPFHSALAAQLTAGWLATTAADLQSQLQVEVAAAWPLATGTIVRVGSGPSDVGATEIPFRIMATLPDAPGAIAYHDVTSEAPDAFLGLDTVTDLSGVSSALSHELCEISGDPNCDQWAPLSSGRQIALELCDPVQERSYLGVQGTVVSDFVLPAFFDASIAGPCSYMGSKGLAPDVAQDVIATGGYEIVRNADGSGETQIFGELSPGKRAHVMARKPSARIVRRLAQHVVL